MNSKKLFFQTFCLLILSAVLFTGCFGRHSAADTALGYYDLILKQDASKLISIGMSSESASKILTDMHTALKTQIKKNLSMANRVEILDSQVDTVVAAYLSALQTLDASIISHPNGNSCEITLSTSYIDFSEIDTSASTLALKEVDHALYPDESQYLKHLVNAYLSHLIEGYQTATASKEQQTATFTFIKQDGLWLPEDYAHFTSTLCQMATSKITQPF